MKLAPLVDLLRAAESEQFGLVFETDDDVENTRTHLYRARQTFKVGQNLTLCVTAQFPKSIWLVKSSVELEP